MHPEHTPEQSMQFLTESAPNPQIKAGRVTDALLEHDIYEPNAPIARYVQSRINTLSAALDHENDTPQTYVYEGDDPNAFADGDAIYVSDGLVRLLDYQEELDGVLAHELMHHDGDHVHKRQSQDGDHLRKLGISRAQELEADIRAMRLLDSAGINPMGLVGAFEKLDAYEAGLSDDGKRRLHHSTVHGSTQDRRINLNQALWLADARHLDGAEAMQPVMIAPEEFGLKLTVNTAVEKYDQLPTALQQQVLYQELRREPSERTLSGKQIARRQLEMIKIHNPDMSDERALAASDAVITCLDRHAPAKDNTLDSLVHDAAIVTEALKDVELGISSNVLRSSLVEHRTEAFLADHGGFSSDVLSDKQFAANIAALRTIFNNGGLYSRELLETIREPHPEPATDAKQLTQICAAMAASNTVSMDGLIRSMSQTWGDSVDAERERSSRIAYAVSNARLDTAGALSEQSTSALLMFVARYPSTLKSGADAIDFMDELINGPNGDHPEHRSEMEHEIAEDYEYNIWGRSLENIVIEIEEGHGYKLTRPEPEEMPTKRYRPDEEPEDDYDEIYDDYYTDVSREDIGTHGPLSFYVADCMKVADPYELIAEILGSDEQDAHKQNALHLALRYAIAGEPDHKEAAYVYAAALENPAAVSRLAYDTVEALGRQYTSELKADAAANVDFNTMMDADAWFEHGLAKLEDTHSRIREIYQNLSLDTEWLAVLAETPRQNDEIKVKALMQLFNHNHLEEYHVVFAETMSDFLRTYGQVSFSTIGNTLDQDAVTRAELFWLTHVESIMAKNRHEGELSKVSLEDLESLLLLSLMVDEVDFQMHVPGVLFAELVSRHSFEEALEMTANTYAHLPGYVTARAIEHLIEDGTRSIENMELLVSTLERKLFGAIDDGAMQLGIMSIIDSHIIESYKTMQARHTHSALRSDEIEGMKPSDLLQAILMTGQDAMPLKRYLFNRWWTTNRKNPQTSDEFGAEDYLIWRHPRKAARLQWWLNQQASDEYAPLDSVMNRAFLANSMARYVALRKILLGDGGALTSEQGRHDLVDGLEGSWLQFIDSPEAKETVDLMLRSLVSVNGPEDLYQYLSPVLQELILRPPQHPTDNTELAEGKARQMLEGLVARGKIDEFDDRDLENITIRVRHLIEGGRVDNSEQSTASAISMLEALTGAGIDEGEQISSLSPVQLAILLGKKSGAIGVRMLQLGGQYYTIPEEDKDQFREIYDQMKGQTRLQAYSLLQREADYAPATAELVGNIQHLGERVGGGSLVTVYEMVTKDGGREVLGVRNPNAAWHVANIADMVDRTLDDAIAKDPNNVDLQLAKSLVYDAVEWINLELNDTTFDQKDAVFKAENDHRSTQVNSFNTGNAHHSVYVPTTRPTGTPWLRREEYIDGNNLNNLRDAEETDIAHGHITPEDRKDVVSVLVRNYTQQLLQGSYAHSDIHPGNFRVTADNQHIVILDRYNLIEMTDERRGTIKQLLGSFISGDTNSALKVFLGATNASIDSSVLDDLANGLEQSSDKSQGMAQLIVGLKKNGVKIPVEIGLIIRNIFSLVSLAEEAGFDSLVGAFTHTAPPEEMVALLAKLSD